MTDQLQQTKPDEHRYYPEDEIELMDYLLVIWKWKYLILVGTLVCGLTAFIVNLAVPKPTDRYRIEMVLEPGVKKIDEDGHKVFIDSAKNIKALIDAGFFNNEIISYFKSSDSMHKPSSLRFTVSIPPETNMLFISHETQNLEEGIKILDCLNKALAAYGNEIVKNIQSHYENNIRSHKNNLVDFKLEDTKIKRQYDENLVTMKKNLGDLIFEEEFIKKKITAAQKAIPDLDSKVKFLAENIQSILNQIDVLNKSSSQNNMHTILQYMTLENSLNKEIQNYYTEKNIEEYKLYQTQSKIKEVSKEIQVLEKRKNNFQTDLIFSPALHQLKNKIAIAQEEIEKLEKKKQSIQNIQIIQPPVTTELPKTKSKIKRNVILPSVLGLFLMLFLSFFFEYISKYKSKASHKSTSKLQKEM